MSTHTKITTEFAHIILWQQRSCSLTPPAQFASRLASSGIKGGMQSYCSHPSLRCSINFGLSKNLFLAAAAAVENQHSHAVRECQGSRHRDRRTPRLQRRYRCWGRLRRQLGQAWPAVPEPAVTGPSRRPRRLAGDLQVSERRQPPQLQLDSQVRMATIRQRHTSADCREQRSRRRWLDPSDAQGTRLLPRPLPPQQKRKTRLVARRPR